MGFQSGYGMKSMKAAGLAMLVAMGAAQAFEHPSIILNMKEIESIKAKIKAGTEPWKSAASKYTSMANGALGKTFTFPAGYNHTWMGGSGQRDVEAKYNYPYDFHRRTSENFGEAINMVAMSWHITGDKKYSDWANKNINSFFLDPSTNLNPGVPGGTTVGIDASLSGVFVGIDLLWPGLNTDIKTKFTSWIKTFSKAHYGHRDGGMHNRGDWWACMSAVSGVLADNQAAIDVAVSQMKKRLDGLKTVDAAFKSRIDNSVGGNYTYFPLPSEGKGDATVQYNYFDIKAIHGVAEVARHHGADLYNYGKVNGVSKIEGMFNYYGALMLNPKLYPDYAAHLASRGSKFLSADFNKTYSIFECLYAYKPNKVYIDVVNKKGRPVTVDYKEGDLLYAATLTHARGAFAIGTSSTPTESTPEPPPSTTAPPPPTTEPTSPPPPTTSTQTPFKGTPFAIPGSIQAEDFDNGGEGVAFHDADGGNNGGSYRSTGVDIQSSSEGGYNIGWTAAGEWLEYTVNVAAAGAYTLSARVASPGSSGAFRVEFGGADKTGSITVSSTGGWQNWTTLIKSVSLAAGQQVMRVYLTGGGFNLNHLSLAASNTTTSPPPPTTEPTPPPPTTSTQSPFKGSPLAIPGAIQAEDFDNGGQGVAYSDGDASNTGGSYRSTGVDIQSASEGGYNVGWIRSGEWLEYTVNVASAGTYNLGARVASAQSTGAFRVEFGGTDKTGSIAAPNTGGWQTWNTVTKSVSLAAGLQVMRVYMLGGPFNLNHISFVKPLSKEAATTTLALSPAARGGSGRYFLPQGMRSVEVYDLGGRRVWQLRSGAPGAVFNLPQDVKAHPGLLRMKYLP